MYVPFSLLAWESDLIVIPEENLKLFCHLSGIFAAMNLWVDTAIATAMVLSCTNITQERDHGLEGKEFWNPIDANKAIAKAEGKIANISDLFSEDISYIHPVKLSGFK